MMSTHQEHNIQSHEDPDAGMTWGIGLIGVFVLIVTVLGTIALYYNAKTSQVKESVIDQPRDDVWQLRNTQLKVLNDPSRWVEREDESGDIKRHLAVPIDRAIELVIEQYGGAKASALDTHGDK